jgi:hypothetical protein
MDAKHLIAVEKWTLAMAAAVVAFSLLAIGGRLALGATLGSLLMCLNAYALRRLAQRSQVFAKPSAVVLLFNLKMALLVAIVYFVIRYLPVDPVGFVIGISIFPAAILAAAIRHALRANEGENHG